MFKGLFTSALATLLTVPTWAFYANDLAILIPLDEQSVPTFNISLADPKFPLVSPQIFQQVLKAADKEEILVEGGYSDAKKWALVSMRYAPCSYFPTEKQVCREQIRLIYQPYRISFGLDSFDDYSMHVIYNLSASDKAVKTEWLSLFHQLSEIGKSANAQEMLAVSPALSNSKTKSAYENFLATKILAPLASTKLLHTITFMGLRKLVLPDQVTNDSHDWIFFSGRVKEGSWAQTELPFGVKEKSQFFREDAETGESMTFKNRKDFKFNHFIDGQDRLKFSLSILSPIRANDQNTDCLSCHIAEPNHNNFTTPNSSLGEIQKIAKGYLASADPESRLVDFLRSRKFAPGNQGIEGSVLRQFGYFGDRPIIGQRITSDNAKAVMDANRAMGIKPNACSSEAKRQATVQCFVQSSESDLKECMKKHCGS